MNINDELSELEKMVEEWSWNEVPEMQSVFGYHTSRVTLRALKAMSAELERLSKLTEEKERVTYDGTAFRQQLAAWKERADLLEAVNMRLKLAEAEIMRVSDESRSHKERLDRIEAYIEREHEKNREKRMTVSLTYNDWRNVLFALDSGKCAYPVLEALYNLIWMQLPSPPPREGSG